MLIQWPQNPKHGDLFDYDDPIGGSSRVFFEYWVCCGVGEWVFIENN